MRQWTCIRTIANYALITVIAMAMTACGGCTEDDNNSTIDVASSGKLLVSPSPISFTRVPLGQEDIIDVQVRNLSSDPLTVLQVTLRPRNGGSVDALTVQNLPQGEFSIPGQASRTIQVRYAPTSTTRTAGQLEFVASDPEYSQESPLVVPINTLTNQPDIQALPAQVRFARQTPENDASFRDFTITNVGSAPLTITREPAYNGGDDFRLDLPARQYPLTLEPFDAEAAEQSPLEYELNVRVRYKALGSGADAGTVLVYSNDTNGELVEGNEDEGVLRVPVTANADAPCILIDSVTRNLGQVPVGQRILDVVEVTNCGTQPLVLQDVELAQNSDDSEYTIDLGSWDVDGDGIIDNGQQTIQPEESDTFQLEYIPTAEGTDQATLIIKSNDPITPTQEVRVIGRGAVGECPDAAAVGRVEGSGTSRPMIGAAPLDYIILDGSASSDPDGTIPPNSPDNWIWEATEYPGDTPPILEPPADRANDYRFQRTRLLLAGLYRFTLKVRDDQGFESCNTAEVTVRAVPNEKLSIELTWTNPEDADETDENGADVDIHLVKMGPGTWFDGTYDVYFDNKDGSWLPESPSLDIDDTDGVGPETIQMDNPDNCQWYAVGVHYYDQNAYGTAYATIRIYVDGNLAFERLNVPLKRQDSFWDVARIHWDSRQIFEVQDTIYQTRPVDMDGNYLSPTVTQPMRQSGLCTDAALY